MRSLRFLCFLLCILVWYGTGAKPAMAVRSRTPTMSQSDRIAAKVAAASLAAVLSAANPTMTHATIEQPAVVGHARLPAMARAARIMRPS